ncbi:hypothetical protein [Mycolicibacterium porcinum]|uniref:hypothetical protein n=1 Tax=Mycolicibacterium porcinum TaxID=39693 RepID=UPI001042070C|nr:hypothetical protein [Mycolicibacterium porcinum]
MSGFLFISPNERGVPRIIAVVSQAIQNAVPSQHQVTDLHHKAATRPAVDAAIAQADFVFYFGHGQVDYLGKSGTRLADAQNLRPTQVVVAIACDSGGGLGPAVFNAWASGAFLGFDVPLGHPTRHPSRANQAYENSLAKFVSSGTVSDLENDLKAELLDAANDYLGRGTMDDFFAFAALRSNMVGLKVSGNRNAFIS